MDKHKAIEKYFKPFPTWAVVCIVIGLPLLAAYGFGLLPIGLGVLGIVLWSKRPTDAQMDQWLDEDLAKLREQALSKGGVDASQLVGETVVVTGPQLWNLPAQVKCLFRKGKDNIVRFTPVRATIINFTENQLTAYTCALDRTTGNPLNESTDEYFYKDVVAVSTKTKSQTVSFGGRTLQLKAAETFELTTSGGTSIEVTLRDPALISVLSGGKAGGDIPTARAEKAIQTVRTMLRQKKAGAT